MRVNHRGANIAVAEEILNSANVVAIFQKMGCKRMAERVRGCGLGDSSFAHSLFHRFL